MTNSTDLITTLEYLSQILLRCFLFAFALLFFVFFMVVLGGDFASSIHSQLFDITKHQFDLIVYGGMIYMKTITFLFFLIPYISIRMVLKKKGENQA